jgi:light-regulated signal transduction histidine kinase (bacteriophytochrome)
LGDVIATARHNLEVAITERGTIFHVPPIPPVVQADSNELTRLFQNLIGNAIKYCAPGVVPEISIDWADEHDHWRFDVRDNGLGIAAEHFDRIFMVFQRLHSRGEYEGTGIGLAICRKIVEHHGGRIWLTSEPGQRQHLPFHTGKAGRRLDGGVRADLRDVMSAGAQFVQDDVGRELEVVQAKAGAARFR